MSFFTGELEPNSGLLRPAPTFARWIYPGLALQLAYNPAMVGVGGALRALARAAHARARAAGAYPARALRWAWWLLPAASALVGGLVYAVSYGARFVAFVLDDVAKHRSGVFTRLRRHRAFQQHQQRQQRTARFPRSSAGAGAPARAAPALAPPPPPLSPIMSPTAESAGADPAARRCEAAK